MQPVGERIDELLESWEKKVEDVSRKFAKAMPEQVIPAIQSNQKEKSKKKSKKKKMMGNEESDLLMVNEENYSLSTLAADIALECYIKVNIHV